MFWSLDGVTDTSVGYAGGNLKDPTYEAVCRGNTNHAEVVYVKYDTNKITFDDLLKAFWEGHDPTQGNRQGNDVGTQYRSVIMCYNKDQAELAQESMANFQKQLKESKDYKDNKITTEILMVSDKVQGTYYKAEELHQKYLKKHPNGYCCLKGTGVVCPMPPRKNKNKKDAK